jgi:hypothetical protein
MVIDDEPTFLETVSKIEGLIRDEITRETVTSWAETWVAADNPCVSDPAVWEALVSLSGADLETEPGEYLHSEVDFRQWLDDLEASHEPDVRDPH